MPSTLALDTNAYRALDDGNETLAKKIKTAVQIALPVIVLGEIYHGIFAGSRQRTNLQQLRHFVSSPRVEVLYLNETTARIFGEIASELRQKGKPIQQDDMWIAALCKQYGHPLATKDTGFTAISGLEVISF